MRAFLFALSLLLATAAWAQAVIHDDAAKSHIGETVTVEGTVAEVHTSHRGDTFLDFGQPYPAETFYAVIFTNHRSTFPDPHHYQGHHLRITGKLRLYRGKPEIILSSPRQIVDSP